MPEVRDDLIDARYVQIVSAKPDRVLPIEMCYDADPPDPGARMCKGWKSALDIGECSLEKCPADKRSVICPIAFWSTSRIVERHTYTKARARALGQHRADFAILQHEPAGRGDSLPVLDGSLVAAARRARSVKPKDVDAAFRSVAASSAPSTEVADWQAWDIEIRDRAPKTLVLLTHTEESNRVLAMEIGAGQTRLLTQIDEPMVRRAADEIGPLVVLLGCSTAVQSRAFQSFVTEFRRAGAPVVVGTLCEILGRQAAPIAASLVEKLCAAAQETERTPIGNLMRALRCEMLGEGYPIVLALAAFGDADWLV